MHNHYKKDVTGLKFIDIYRVCKLFNVTDPCIQHAVKKLLCAGQRGAKSESQDVQEAIDTLVRYQEMQGETRGGYAHPLPPSVEKPWYPDDSGEWVENYLTIENLSIGTRVTILLDFERESKFCNYWTMDIEKNIKAKNNSGIVAYKVIK